MPFKPGQSGNPSGHRKTKPITDALIYIGNQPYAAPKKNQELKVGLPKKPTNFQAMAARMFKSALEGDAIAARDITDRMEGKVPQAVIGGPEDAPPIQTQDITMKEVARRIGFLLLSESESEGGA